MNHHILVHESHWFIDFLKFLSRFCYYDYTQTKVGKISFYSPFSLTLSILQKFHKSNCKSFRPIFFMQGKVYICEDFNYGSNIFDTYKTIQIFYFLCIGFGDFCFKGNCPFNLYCEIQQQVSVHNIFYYLLKFLQKLYYCFLFHWYILFFPSLNRGLILFFLVISTMPLCLDYLNCTFISILLLFLVLLPYFVYLDYICFSSNFLKYVLEIDFQPFFPNRCTKYIIYFCLNAENRKRTLHHTNRKIQIVP